ncbi:CrcB family protein [Curtobacterium flaccumfaciens]|nr:CrcB family protein [Curtobacterium flaccumfaciens]
MTEHSKTSASTMPPDDVQLPVDADIEVEESPRGAPRPVHARWSFVGVVAAGGTLGTAARAMISDALPAVNGVSWTIFGVNVIGAFLLGLLLEALADRGADEGLRRNTRLGLGTGFLGGFTTYSTLATGTAKLLIAHRLLAGTGYAVATVVAGAIATALGLVVAGGARPRRKGTP